MWDPLSPQSAPLKWPRRLPRSYGRYSLTAYLEQISEETGLFIIDPSAFGATVRTLTHGDLGWLAALSVQTDGHR